MLCKIIFDNRIIPSAEEVNVTLIEVIRGRKLQAATHLALDKKLISDVSNARKLLIIAACADATKYCVSMAHPFTSMCAQYLGVELSCIVVVFRAIQIIKMCLRTLFIVPDNYYFRDGGRLF